MATFLVTKKMSPELAARVESSVRGRRIRAGESLLGPRMIAILRVAIVAALIAVIWAFLSARRKDARRFEQDRSALLEKLSIHSSALTPTDHGSLARDEDFVNQLAGTFDGEIIDPAIDRTALRPSVYVRGNLAAFTHKDTIASAAITSVKDAFLACLVSPPKSTSEKALVSTILDAYAAMDAQTPTVRRLGDAEVGILYLLPAYADRVRASSTDGELAIYQKEVSKVSLDKAVLALKAEVMIAVIDEPGIGASEMDGEKPHAIRVGIIDRGSRAIVLRVRRQVDPSGFSASGRAQFASALDGCKLAADLRVKPE